MASKDWKPEEIVAFWKDAGPQKWFAKDDAFDREIRDRFLDLYEAIAANGYREWLDMPRDCLAYCIAIDQFPRNIFRNSPRAFAADSLGIAAAWHALRQGHAASVEKPLRPFLFMPLMHSEEITDQTASVAAQHAHGGADNVRFARIHRDIILRFGRFPHRNAVLGRHTTPAEAAFLESGGFSG